MPLEVNSSMEYLCKFEGNTPLWTPEAGKYLLLFAIEFKMHPSTMVDEKKIPWVGVIPETLKERAIYFLNVIEKIMGSTKRARNTIP